MTIAVPAWARHEVKFVAAAGHHDLLEHWIRVHPACFHSPFPPRRVNNVYFDDHELFAYRENLVGVSARSKVRLRWYGDTAKPSGCTLEVKRRRNMLGWKLGHPIGPIDLESDTWREIRGKMRADLPPEGRLWLDANPQPVLINRYQRQYFLSRDGEVRLTLDRGQVVHDQRLAARPNLTRKANLPDTVVVEFKFAREDFEAGSRAIQGIPIRVSRNSKYVIAVSSIAG